MVDAVPTMRVCFIVIKLRVEPKVEPGEEQQESYPDPLNRVAFISYGVPRAGPNPSPPTIEGQAPA